MSKENERLLTITTEDGSEILCEILFTHHSEDFNKDYVVFTEQGTNNASAAIYVPTADGNGRLEEIKSEEEWAMLEELLEEYADNMEQADGCGCGCDDCEGGCGDEECGCDDEGCDCQHEHK